MAIDNRTTGRNYPLPHPSNLLAEDVQRLRDALIAIDGDVVALDQLIDDVVNGAPEALNTLNELAAALNDDANFAATVTVALNNRYTKAESDARYVQGVTQTENVFTGNGSQTAFTLTQAPPTRESLLVTVDGVVQPTTAYNLSGTSLILSEAPANGASIRVLMLGVAGPMQSASTLNFTQAGTGAVTRTVDSKLKDTIHVKDFGAVGDGTTDDTAAIQAAITAAAGKTLVFDAVTYKTTSTLTIASHGTKLQGRRATIDYYGTAHAIGFGLVGGTTYPVEIEIRDLAITVNTGSSSSGLLVRTSYSRYYNVGVSLKTAATSAKGFVLVGDEVNGTGPYYNLFQACAVQSQSLGLDHIGVQFSSQAPGYRAGNANTWVGGRIGQCATGFYITGNGNTIFHPTVENASFTGIAFDFVSPVAFKCTQNNVIGAYIENANTGFRFGAGTIGNGLFNPYATGVSTFITDLGTDNIYVTGNSATKLPTGVKFGSLSSDANVLDYYEEGTWTPALSGFTTAGNYTLTTSTAKYTRIGKMVHVTFLATITINSAGSGEARFSGLPFAKASGTVFTGSVNVTNFTLPASNSGVIAVAWTTSADSTFSLAVNRSATSPYGVTCADIGAGASISASVTYFV